MGESKQILLGIDLKEDVTQVSLYHLHHSDMISVSMSADTTNPLVPTCLLVKESTKEWYFGEEAIRFKELNAGIFVDHLLSRVKREESIEIYSTVFTPIALLSKFFKKILGHIRQNYLNTTISKLVITSDDTSPKMCEAIYESLALLGLERDRVSVISRVQSFMYYILSQKQDLWSNDVGLFHFDENGLMYYRMSVNRRSHPIPVLVHKINLTEEFNYLMLEADETERFSQRFENTVNQLLHKRLTTSLFFTGEGFSGVWIDAILKRLCVGRRVFKGQNLYTKGACYAAKAMLYQELQDYLLLSDEMITSSIYLRLYQDAKEMNYELAQAGTPWWQIDESITVILDKTKDLEFTVVNLLKREPIKEVVHMDGVMERENKTIRLSLNLHFVDRETAVLTIRDTGFGEFYETTYRIWEEILTL